MICLPPFFYSRLSVLTAMLTVLGAIVFSGCAKDYSLISNANPYAHSYAVVVSKETYALGDWRGVADSLVAKHMATLVVYEGTVTASREQLAQIMPRYTAFVARPEECGRDYIAAIHRLTRKLDEDPWLDTQWGVITGRDANAALRLVQVASPLEIKRALATTGLKDSLFDEYFLLRDGGNPPGGWLWKKSDGTVTHGTRESLGKNSALAWAEKFAQAPDLVVTSSHGFENGVEMPLPLRDGIIRTSNGALYALPDWRQGEPKPGAIPIPDSDNPKIYFPVGNCLVGHVNARDCMVTTMMGAYGVRQMAGYTVNTWFGRAWNMLALWQTLPARNSFAECFFFNQQHILHDIAALDPKAASYEINLGIGEVTLDSHLEGMLAHGVKFDLRNARQHGKTRDRELAGLLWDMDTIAFYGDPAWRAAFGPRESAFVSVGIDSKGDRHTLTMRINDRMQTAQNTVPIGIIFSLRLKNTKIVSGGQYQPILADNFLLLLKPQPKEHEQEIVVEFEGEPISPPPKTNSSRG